MKKLKFCQMSSLSKVRLFLSKNLPATPPPTTMKSKERSPLALRLTSLNLEHGWAKAHWVRIMRSTMDMKSGRLAEPPATPQVLARCAESANWQSHALDILSATSTYFSYTHFTSYTYFLTSDGYWASSLSWGASGPKQIPDGLFKKVILAADVCPRVLL